MGLETGQHARAKQADHGAAELEQTHLGTFLQGDGLVACVVPAHHLLLFGRRYVAGPDGLDAGHDSGTDQHQRHGAMRGAEGGHHPFVAGKQVGHVFGGERVDREEIPRHEHHALQHAIERHMDAVVILGRQIDGGEVAILERRHQILITAQQLAGAVVVALGLDDTALADGAELADGAIDRQGQGHGVFHQGANTGLELTGEELVEALVVGRALVQRLAHVDLVLLDKGLDHLGGEVARFGGGKLAHQAGEGVFGQTVLTGNFQVVSNAHVHHLGTS